MCGLVHFSLFFPNQAPSNILYAVNHTKYFDTFLFILLLIKQEFTSTVQYNTLSFMNYYNFS